MTDHLHPSSPNRRDFFRTVSAAGAPFLIGRPLSGEAVSVEADFTIFFGHPAGERRLVRFRVRDIDAPAGRLRMYSPRRELLGTAGLIPNSQGLYGELWATLGNVTRVISSVETPGRRSPIETTHTVTPAPRWTIFWATVVSPEALRERLLQTSSDLRQQTLDEMLGAHLAANPFLATAEQPRTLDHLSLLRSSNHARALEREFGIPTSPIAVAPPSALTLGSVPMALAGAGVAMVVVTEDVGGSAQRLNGRDGSSVLVTQPTAGGDPIALGFDTGGNEMVRRVEAWLSRSSRSGLMAPNTALVLATDLSSSAVNMKHAVDEWNRLFAFPKIETGDLATLLQSTPSAVSVPVGALVGQSEAEIGVSTDEVVRAARHRRDVRQQRIGDVFDPLARLLAASEPGAEGVAQQIASPLASILVFNSAPVSSSNCITMPDGTERIVTDVPPLGYVHLPLAVGGGSAVERSGPPRVTGQRFVAACSPITGALTSLTDRRTGRQLSVGNGLNAVRNGTVQRYENLTIPGVGERTVLHLSSPTTNIVIQITAYDDYPWLDIRNEAQDATASIDYTFHLQFAPLEMSWETPAGFETRTSFNRTIAHLRWVELRNAERERLLIRAREAPWMSILQDATGSTTMTSHSPAVSSIRLHLADPDVPFDEPWVFGWRAEPLHTVPIAPQTGRNLPGWAALVRGDVGRIIVGLKPADDGEGVIAYVQDIAGYGGSATIRSDLLRFTTARIVDYVERDQNEPLDVANGVVALPIRPFGVTAVRLSGLSYNGG